MPQINEPEKHFNIICVLMENLYRTKHTDLEMQVKKEILDYKHKFGNEHKVTLYYLEQELDNYISKIKPVWR